MPIPAEKMDAITVALDQVTTSNNYEEIFLRLFWTTSITLPNTLIIFLGEFKKVRGNRNQNQLLLDFRTAQSHRLALGLPDAIIWGSTCAMGNFKVYSSEWNEDHTVSPPFHIPCHRRSVMTRSSIGACITHGT
jgi:hypothetical protein